MTPGHSHSLKIPVLRPVSSNPVATDWKKTFYPLFIILLIFPPEREGLNVEVMEGKVCARLVQEGRGGCQEQSCQPSIIFIRNSYSLLDNNIY